jgi:hypothetical protein
LLVRHPDFDGSIHVARGADGHPRATGKTEAHFGYTLSESPAQGVWARWRWHEDVLTVENDRFGFLPVYYAADGDGIRVATSIRELLALGVDRRLDDEALAVFLRLGQYLGEDTPFAAIRTLPPGSRLTWAHGRVTIECHTQTLPRAEGPTPTREAAVRRYGELTQVAVERLLPEADVRMCVPLSAGRDSRHIVYAMVRAGRRPDPVITARAMAPRPDTDAETAARICAGIGLRHEIIEQTDDRYGDERRKNLLTGYFADEHVQTMPIVRWLRDHDIEVTWDGIAGDIFSCGVYDSEVFVSAFQGNDLRPFVENELGEEGYLASMLKPEALRRWPRAVAEERLMRELARYRDLPNPVAPYFFLNRVRRKLALSPFGMLNQGTHVLCPYLDHDLFDSLINLPLAFAILYASMGAQQQNAERAARDLGADEARVVLLVTVPMLMPAIAAAFFLSVTLSWDEFIIAFLLTRFDVTLPVEIWSMLRSGLSPRLNAIGSLVFLVSVTAVVILETLVFRKRRP